jgi:hypothetical protein
MVLIAVTIIAILDIVSLSVLLTGLAAVDSSTSHLSCFFPHKLRKMARRFRETGGFIEIVHLALITPCLYGR